MLCLFDIASKTDLNTDDIYTVLAALRFVPKEDDNSKYFEKGYETLRDKGSMITLAECNQLYPKDFNGMSRLIFYVLKIILENQSISKNREEYTIKSSNVDNGLNFIVKIRVFSCI